MQMPWRQWARQCPYTKEDVIKMSEEEVRKKVASQCEVAGHAGYNLGWYDDYIGTPVKDLPESLKYLYLSTALPLDHEQCKIVDFRVPKSLYKDKKQN